MSIVNQVLNELEKRGANAPLGEATLRPVPPRKQSYLPMYALFAVALLILLAALKWFLERNETPPPERVVAAALPMADAVPASSGTAGPDIASASAAAETIALSIASDVADASQPYASLRGKPLLEVKSEDEPVAAPETKKVAQQKPQPAADSIAESGEALAEQAPEDLQLKKISPQQQAEYEFQKANRAVQEGRMDEALAGYKNALLADPTYKPARRGWVGALLGLKRNDEAERVLQKGLRHDSHDTWFAMLLARLQVERGDLPLALQTLQNTLPFAEGQADYQSFVAALLQRENRHEEAVERYRIALKLAPNNGVWCMGLGISLQALQRGEEARAAYQRALATNTLNPQLQAFVQQKLKEL
ncbi:MAG: tetratricopeptide repeat protein [Nitrosomonadales bacterium]|nr:tetratricopeptide repeat protein [Nitrosomonadales bacterium]